MGKHGPCYHCGVTSTPLWRNGPPEKPVLCNACGSRWRTKGSLTNYTPMHSRPDDFVDKKVSKVKIISTNKNKEVNLLKRKQNHDIVDTGAAGIRFDHYSGGFKKVKDEQSSTRSSCGSVVSNSESCSQFHVADASDMIDPAESVVWETLVPSKKRACASHTNQSSVEKLTKDLHSILREQQSSYVSGSPENDLLVESEMPMASVEIHGSFLIKQPNPVAIAEESEASSITVENKIVLANDAYSHEQQMLTTKLKSEKYDNDDENFQILANCNSPLRNIDLNKVFNFEEFMRHLTNDEQQELVKFLPLADVMKYPDNLKKMFESKQFKESLYSFQHLLGEGVFDVSLVGIKNENGEALKKLAPFGLIKCERAEPFNKLIKICESNNEARDFERGPDVMNLSKFVNIKSSCDDQYRNVSEVAATMASPKPVNVKANDENKEVTTYNDSLLMSDTFHFTYESFDEDILLDVPYSSSFPQAELLH